MTFYSQHMFVTSIVGSVCPKMDLLVIWDLMKANFWRFSLQKYFCSNLEGTCVNSVTKYVGLQQVWEVKWVCTGAMSTEKAANSFFPHWIGFARIYGAWGVIRAPKSTLSKSKRWPSSAKKWQSLYAIFLIIVSFLFLFNG